MASASVNVLDSEYFKKKASVPFLDFSPNFSKTIEVADKGSELIKELKFPWSLKDLISEYPHAKLKSLVVTYTPYIHMTNHGTVMVTIKDKRKLKQKTQNVCIFRFPTDCMSQMIVTNLEPCTRTQKNPYVMSIHPDLFDTAPDAIIGKIHISATFSYSKEMYPIMMPRIDINSYYTKDKEVLTDVSHEDTLAMVEVKHTSS
ncbi:TPA_asm: P3 [Artemisia betacytorhabdovirus 1]|nr:TPA_asm: P3 [Artemisia betacytorhabdovirus 1]